MTSAAPSWRRGERLLVVGAPPPTWLEGLVLEAGCLPYLLLDPAAQPESYAGYPVFHGTLADFLALAAARPAEFTFHHLLVLAGGPESGEPPISSLSALVRPGGQVLHLDPRALPPPAPPAAHRLSLVYRTVLFEASGYAAEARDFIQELVRRGHLVRVEPVGAQPPGPLSPEQAEFFTRLTYTDVAPAESIHITAVPVTYATPPQGYKAIILRTMFETESIPAAWAEHCNRFDEVWVPSRQNIAAFARSGVRPEKLHLVPGAIDPTRFHPAVAPMALPLRHRFNFLSVFDWHFRKGWDLLLTAYLEEFRPIDDVALYLKVHQLSKQTGIASELAYYLRHRLEADLGETPDIILIEHALDDAAMPRLYRAMDAFVLPSRGEGYGRPYLEAMALGLPVIGTAWGGQADFLTPATGYPVAIEGMEEVSPYEPIAVFRGLRWARPSLGELRRQMRAVVTDPAAARAKGRQAAAAVAAGWHPGAAVDAMVERLCQIKLAEG